MLCQSVRDLPSLGALLEQPSYLQLAERHGLSLLKPCLKEVLAEIRQRLLAGGEAEDLSNLSRRVQVALEPSYTPVLNATGTVLHTNLGRAPLGLALTSICEALSGYSPLEYQLEGGRRGRRGAKVEGILRWLTGAQAALVVNNCAAAMVLLLSTHAKNRQVIVSRGELVEIGGGFRIPDILATSGAQLVEVGTTNRTRIEDYRRAVTEDTGLLLTTHSSNFRMVGFTEAPTHEELLDLGRELGIPVAFDLGSGMLSQVVQGEPTVAEAARFPLAAFSGDKLLGGPQCGVLLGRRELVEQCRRHPLYRAFRCGKVTLALVEETLRRHARDPKEVAVLGLLGTPLEELESRAVALAQKLQEHLGCQRQIEVQATKAQVGGGSLPGGSLESWAVTVASTRGRSLERDARVLRMGTPGVVGRVEDDRLLFDLRAVPPEHDSMLFQALLEGLR